MHHGKQDEHILPMNDELVEHLAALKKKAAARSPGATGEFPGGKLTAHDEGEIAFVVGSHDGKVVIEFGGPVAWIGMSPEQAVELAKTLRSHARTIVDGGAMAGSPKKKLRRRR